MLQVHGIFLNTWPQFRNWITSQLIELFIFWYVEFYSGAVDLDYSNAPHIPERGIFFFFSAFDPDRFYASVRETTRITLLLFPIPGKGPGCRMLKRQFSLDRPDDPVSIIPEPLPHRSTPRLYKQNSAGAANDLERIEEVPATPKTLLQNYRHAASVSLSVESLSLHWISPREGTKIYEQKIEYTRERVSRPEQRTDSHEDARVIARCRDFFVINKS